MAQPQGDIQERIAAARREAEVLKEKIRASREASADTSRTSLGPILRLHTMTLLAPSACDGCRGRHPSPDRDAPTTCAQGTPCKDLCHALGCRSTPSRLSLTGWKANRLGRLYHQQGPCNPSSVELGHDLCILAIWKFRRMWWS